MYIYIASDNKTYYTSDILEFSDVFEDANILKCGYKQKQDYILLKQSGIEPKNLMFDVEIAGYILNSNINKYTIEYLGELYLGINIDEYISSLGIEEKEETQINLFESQNNNVKSDNNVRNCIYAYCINKLYYTLTEQMKQTDSLELFRDIEMPLSEVLSNMQYNGIYVEKNELIEYGKSLQEKIQELTKEIFSLTGEEFNINSTKQLGEVLFEKLQLPTIKKTKTGYSTDSDVLEKLKENHPVIEKLLDYRQLVKLNSTYVEGLIPYIDNFTRKNTFEISSNSYNYWKNK